MSNLSQTQGGTSRLEATLAHLKAQHKKALVAYVMAGDPTPAFTEQLVPLLAQAGADIIELGFPFSDPMADGPVIQAASQRALRQFAHLDDFFALVKRIRQQTAVPLVLMTYYNLVLHYGHPRFFAAALAAGLDGAIIPDLALEEAQEWRSQAQTAGFATIFLEAPNTTPANAKAIADASRGFIYMISLKGVTGSDKGMGEKLQDRVARLRALTTTPLLVGFGISTAEHARLYGPMSDGIIVGSALISCMEQAQGDAARLAAAQNLIRQLRQGLDA